MICPNCGHDYNHSPGLFGKVCMYCQYVIESDFELDIQKMNRIKFEELRRKAISQIIRKLKAD